ncbi:hypothetical protein Sme01_30060 [Sphaerisporangium melleum]|uniref:ABC transmembrane type-1 domain-containing protein n=1 Tax=Sphaerisporangium melleum TaxID=321316 RepID=A0A917R338_9ACTN|nr:hypothetical protein [Sphaerisporangium melleum]GGK85354.1 hypothetical protein GCM10007964_29840 [Sphaerisporangium melleum]GII70530.1 hypothetical protein Sme01_30060 [Sphaerisporangium melleum]
MTGGDAFLFDLTPHHDVRAPARWQGTGRHGGWVYLLPAAALVSAVLLAPLAVTAVTSLTGGPSAYLSVLTDQDVRFALLHSLGWLLLALGVCGLGLGLARLAQDAGPRTRALLLAALALPAVTSPLTAGTAFRLIFDADPARGTVSALLPGGAPFLGPGWIWLVLGLAFVWQWTGLACLAFQVGLANLPTGLLRVARVFGAGRLRRFRAVVAPALFPTAGLVMLVVLTAAVRVFELVLVGAPGSVQARVDVVGLFWWRHRGDLGDGPAAALGVLLTVMAMAVAAVTALLWRVRRNWTDAGPPARLAAPPTRRRGPAALTGAAAVAIALIWALPFAVLLLTSLRSPEAVATSGWWTGGYGLGSFREAFEGGVFAGALGATAERAVLVAALVVLFAVPAAYALTPGRLPARAQRIAAAVAVLLAVLPPQVAAMPLAEMLGALVGVTVVLAVIQAALVLPLGVLLLRGAFIAVPRPVVLRPLAEGRSAIARMTVESGPAVLAVAVLAFVLAWNDLVAGLLLNWPAADQAPLVVLQQTRHFSTSAGAFAAQEVVLTVVPVVLALATGRVLARGLTRGVRR